VRVRARARRPHDRRDAGATKHELSFGWASEGTRPTQAVAYLGFFRQLFGLGADEGVVQGR
jgi:hypothetical protein